MPISRRTRATHVTNRGFTHTVPAIAPDQSKITRCYAGNTATPKHCRSEPRFSDSRNRGNQGDGDYGHHATNNSPGPFDQCIESLGA